MLQPRNRDAPQRIEATAIFSSSEPVVATSYIFSISAKLEAGVVISEFVNDGVRGEPFITRDQQEMLLGIT
jgi:hypothetical protein